MSTRLTATWRDSGFRERVTVLTSHDGAGTTLDDLALLSTATITTTHEGQTQGTFTTSPSEDSYPDLSDRWIITAQDLTGDSTQLYIPAPLLSETDVDGRNWNSGSAAWTGFQTFLAAMNHPYTGAPLTSVTAAMLARDAGQIAQQWFNFSTAITWGRRTLQWWDTHGNAHLDHLIGDVSSLGASFDDVMAAMGALSAAVVLFYWEGEMSVFSTDPAVGLYSSVNDQCTVTFADVDGNETQVFIPSPDRAIFLPDGKTLNQEQVNVASFIAQAITDLIIPISGLNVDRCVNGVLGKRGVY